MSEVTGLFETIKVVKRCHATVARALKGDCDEADLDAAAVDLQRLPADLPGRGRLAAGLVFSLLRGGLDRAPQRLRHLEGLLAIADSDPPPGPQWPQVRCMARVGAVVYASVQGKAADPGAALADLDALAGTAGDDPAMTRLLDAMRMVLVFLRAHQDGDETVLCRMPAEAARLGQLAAGDPALASLADSLVHVMNGYVANQRGDFGEAWRAVDRLVASTDNLPPGHHLRDAVAESRTSLHAPRGVFDGAGDYETLPTDDQLAALAAMGATAARVTHPGAIEDSAIYHVAAGGARCFGHVTDLGRFEAGIEHLRKAVALTPPDDTRLAYHLSSLALGLLRRTEVTGVVAGLDEAVELLERARELLGGPQHPQWSMVNELLSEVRYRCGQFGQARQSGLDGQRSYALRVLLQSDAAGAKIAIRDAAISAVDLARRCLSDNNPADALSALDTGRGLMLFAATELRNVAVRLDEAGRPDLARRWEAAASGEADGRPENLRREVFTVLASQAGSLTGLLDPPSLAEIQSALVALDADALVYLIPGEPPQPGMAIIAPVDGPPGCMALPNLVVRPDDEVERYLTALVSRSRDLTSATNHGRLAGSLAALCDWAWRAAVGPLLGRYVASLPPPASGRVPRLVLVPMGDLARIPWHAARPREGTYAVQRAAFSQAVSARMLCDCAARSPVPLSPSGLVVGDPDTAGRAVALDAARREAYAIRQAFYRGARYIGRRPDGSPSPSGAGTADQVREWLANPAPAAGTMLHLACHGSFTVDPDDARSYLLLAGDELSAEELMAVMAKSAHRDVGLVVLAACHTGRSVHGYDEAYSLGTAFLAGGARSVLSTQWSVPDVATSSLMFMFHYHLRHEGLPAWQALRQAQLWMLDPDRRPPPQMPAELYRQPSAGDHADVLSWAGFVHWGQ